MRKLNIYVFQDTIAEVFSDRLLALPNDEVAKRVFTDVSNNKQGEIGMHIDDYIMWKIGYYDRVTGEIKGCVPPIRINFNKSNVKEGEKKQ